MVRSCDDGETIVLVSGNNSPAFPFVFRFYKNEGIYILTGEGTGDKDATKTAYEALSKLNEFEIELLLSETKIEN